MAKLTRKQRRVTNILSAAISIAFTIASWAVVKSIDTRLEIDEFGEELDIVTGKQIGRAHV